MLASFAGARAAVPEIAESLVRHLHAFVHEVAPTEEEWFAGIEFLTRAGHLTTDTRQEFVLLSDVLGVSMLVIGLNHPAPRRRHRVDGVRAVLRRGGARARRTAPTWARARRGSPAS